MMKNEARRGFTLVELLTLIAIIGILSAILVPVLDRFRQSAARTVDLNDLRQVVQASLNFADDHGGELPMRGGSHQDRFINQDGEVEISANTTPSIHAIAVALARHSELNEGSIWVSAIDPDPNADRYLTAVWESGSELGGGTVNNDFQNSSLSLAYIAGLNLEMRPSTPIAFTRGLSTNQGLWHPNQGVYGMDGGYIGFLAGNVRWYNDTGASWAEGAFIDIHGGRTNDVLRTIDENRAIYSDPSTIVSSPGGTRGQG